MEITVKITDQEVREMIRVSLLPQFPDVQWNIGGPSYCRSDWTAESVTPKEPLAVAEDVPVSAEPKEI